MALTVIRKGITMSGIKRAAVFGTVMILIAGVFVGCKKSEPGRESRRTTTTQKQVKPPKPKVVGPRITEPTETDIAQMEAALESSDFQQGFRLKAADEYIDVRIGHLVPYISDWNNDGKKDMVMGQFMSGAITLFENIGTDEAPVLGEGKPLLAGDKPIKLDAG